jgi:hypothetical protein
LHDNFATWLESVVSKKASRPQSEKEIGMNHLNKVRFWIAAFTLAAWPSFVFAQGNQPSSSQQPPTGTTDANGNPNRKTGTITSSNGDTANVATPLGTDPSAAPANRNPYNDRNYRQGTPGTGSVGRVAPNSISPGGAETLGTAAPAEIGPTPGLHGTSGQAAPVVGEPTGLRTGGAALPGNPGPVGNMNTPNAAPTVGNVGTNGSGASGIPGSISNSGTSGNAGSGF